MNDMSRIRPFLFAAGLTLMAPGALTAEETGPEKNEYAPEPGGLETFWNDVRFNGEISSLYTHTNPEEGIVNPNNSIKRIETGNWNTVARTEFSYKNRAAGINLRLEPWFSFERHFFDHAGGAPYSEENIQIGRYQAKFSGLIPRTTLAAQRGIVAWGPAFFGSPSNPFPDTSSTANPLEEEFGSDFLWMSHAFNGTWSMSAYQNYSRGSIDSVDSNPFKRAGTVAVHYNSYNYNVSLLAGNQEDYGPIYGAYGQWTLGEATVLYFDAGLRKRGRARYPVESSNILGGTYNSGKAVRKPEIVVGGSYTTADDTTFYGEYLFQGSGYSKGELDLARDIALAANENLVGAPALSEGTLGLAALNELPYLGQHNASLIVSRSIGDFDLTFQNQTNMQDFTGRLYGSVVYSYGPAKFTLSLLQAYGREGGAFRQSVDTQVVSGMLLRF
ncbi:hypothetical protein [Aestuariispira insulae]|nr:hypothetical protein [Aestuariispira insulae]